ncbi:MAG: hypothetical protein KQH83_02685 [Actinobacteria bacterium]|nr:hypothetical protein [Actinomycetota bacterium]
MRLDHATYSPLRRSAAILLVAMLLTALQPAGDASADTIFTFEGGGYGHSVGMSQFGAYGMALDGYTWEEIVTHYYTDTTVGAADPLFTEAPLWVGIRQEQSTVEFVVRAIGADAVPVTITRGEDTLTARPGEAITIQQAGGGGCTVTTPEGSLTGPCTMDLEWDGWEESPTSALELQGCTLPDWNAPGGTVYKPCTYARGTMHIRPDNNTATVAIALEIDVEDYVLGISESPYGWGSTGGMAALEAQAVAARSYAIHRAADRGDPASRPWCWCQLYDTPVDQNYVGWGHGTQNWIDAVHATEDMVVLHPSSTRQGVPLPIEAFYSSSTFGWTEHSEVGFTAFVPYLRGVDDHWSLDPRTYNHSGRWTRSFSGSTLAARLPGMSSVTGLEVTACSDSGSALEITFTGSGGPRTFTTRELRAYLGLRSMQILRAGSPLPAEPACPQPGDQSGGEPPADGGPAVLAGITLDDDASGDSSGNGNGIAECGEIVEVFTDLTNEGEDLHGVAATLISNDPYVSVVWNTASTYPDLAAGATAPNDADWDLAVAPDTPDGHPASLTLRVMADNGGPWNLDVTLPTACAATEPPPPPPEPGPATLTGITLDDDASGDSSGNGNGIAECGEIVEVFTDLTNEGADLHGVAATLTSDDPYVSVVWNTTSSYPDLAAGATAPNDADWDLAVAPGTPDGHLATLTLDVSAADGGPWSHDVEIATSCPTVDASGAVGIGDLDGNGSPDVATVMRDDRDDLVVEAWDTATGARTGRVKVGDSRWEMLDLDRVPGTDGAVAVLMVRDNGAARVVAADLSAGQRTGHVYFGRRNDAVAAAVLQGDPARIAVAFQRGSDRTVILVKNLDNTFDMRFAVRTAPIALEAFDSDGDGAATDLALLGARRSGDVGVDALGGDTGNDLWYRPLGAGPAQDLAALDTDGSIDRVAVLHQAGGVPVVETLGGADGRVIRSVTVPLASAEQLEALPPLGGSTGDTVAVFGLTADGAPSAVVADPHQGRLVAGPIADPGVAVIDVTVAAPYGPSGAALVSLGVRASIQAVLVLSDAATGAGLGTLQIP